MSSEVSLEKIMLNLDEKNDFDNADAIRDVMDILWYNMSEEMEKLFFAVIAMMKASALRKPWSLFTARNTRRTPGLRASSIRMGRECASRMAE